MVQKIKSFFNGGNLILNKNIVGWIAGGAVTLINVVFYLGVSNANKGNDFKELKELTVQNSKDISDVKETFKNFTLTINNKFTKVYDDQYNSMVDYQAYSKKQFELIIEYGLTNKKLMKDILDMNHTEEMNKMKKESEKSKNDISNTKMIKMNIDSTTTDIKILNNKIIIPKSEECDSIKDSVIASTGSVNQSKK